MDELFQFFFKYRLFFFKKGRIAFEAAPSFWTRVVLAVMLAGLIFCLYRLHRMRSGPRFAISAKHPIPWLALLRGFTVAVLVFMLCQPVLQVFTVRHRENIAAVLIDDSRSMAIEDAGGKSRLEAVKQILDPQRSPFLNDLSNRFQTSLFRFSRDSAHVRTVEGLQPKGTGTGLEQALENIVKEYSTSPLGSVVVFTDGADNLSASLKAAVAELQTRKIPVNVCAVGETDIGMDIEVNQASAPQVVLPESITTAVVSIRSNGYAGRPAVLEIKEDGRLVQSKSVTLPAKGETRVIEVELTPKGAGLKSYTMSVVPPADERITVNNSQSLLLNVEDSKPKILFLEGTPRWEFKFLRQALQPDKNLQLVSLLRTSGNKFYRQGVENEDNLASGFPSTREELFQYKGLILGSVEASFFSSDQLKIMADFVGDRGGGFLMVGGRKSFDAGKYSGTPIAEILPVVLGLRSQLESFVEAPVNLQLTPHGRSHPATRLVIDQDSNEKRWKALPQIEEFNRIEETKPGASLLAYGETGKRRLVLLAVHRYGRGRVAAFTPASSWRWRMLMPHEDDSHEIFWRQMSRWLVASTPSQISLELDRTAYQPEDIVPLQVEVNDPSFVPINDAAVTVAIEPPSGRIFNVPLRSSGARNGLYRGQVTPSEHGTYRMTATALQQGKEIGKSVRYFVVTESNLEFYNAGQNKELLTRLADDTGGRYYTLKDVGKIPEEMAYTNQPNSVPQTLPLWDMPVLFVLICSSLFAEWFLRKHQGLA